MTIHCLGIPGRFGRLPKQLSWGKENSLELLTTVRQSPQNGVEEKPPQNLLRVFGRYFVARDWR